MAIKTPSPHSTHHGLLAFTCYSMAIKFVLVTGATGFIGAHIVDALLSRGLRVRGATRSMAKGEAMMKARPQYKEQLEFVQINDFESPGGLVDAVKGVDGIIHTASVSPNPPYYTIQV